MQRAAVIVCPYTDATQSGVIMTAYALGKPIIATDVGGIPEIIDNGSTGILVPPRDSHKLSEAIIYLLKTPAKRKEMANNITNKFNQNNIKWSYTAKQTLKVYEKAIRKK